MIEFVLPAKVVLAAMLFQAKQDIRFYLNGFRVEKKHIVATDGHSMFIHELHEPIDIEESMIIKMVGKVPAKATELHFKIDPVECNGIALAKFNGVTFAAVFFELIEGKYPDWRRVVPEGELVATSEIGVNAAYMKRIQDATKLVGNPRYQGVTMNLYGKDRVIRFDINGPEFKSVALVMPMRM